MATTLEEKPHQAQALSLEEHEARGQDVRGPQPVAGTAPFSVLKGRKYIKLATFRKSGEAVATPVWFATVAGRLYVTTAADSGKAKRIRNSAKVIVTPCTPTGKSLGPTIEATARILPPDEQEQAESALVSKYGLQLRIFKAVWRWGGHKHIFLEIAPRSA